jgi:PhzF family phenazine biosynthesis protein
MKLELFQVDAFTDKIFGGNPACVIPLQEWLADNILLKLARENAVAETAFFIDRGDHYQLRWFTPEIEMDLCGHATLATAHVLIEHLNKQAGILKFETKSGTLSVSNRHGMYTLNFPSRMPVAASLPDVIRNAINIQPACVLKARDYVLVYEFQQDVENIRINRQIFDQINLAPGGLIVTAPGNNCDFVSRFFTPQSSILEDPVTGSAHCSLIPYWSMIMDKNKFLAMQLSERVGVLHCENLGDRVLISGQARTYSSGYCWVD